MPHVTNHRNEVQPRETLLQIKQKPVHRGLSVVVKNQLRDTEAGQLAAEFGTDGAGSAGDEYGFALEIGTDGIERNLNLLASEQVLHLDFPRSEEGFSFFQFIHGGSHQALDSLEGTEMNETVLLRAGVPLCREEDGIDTVTCQYLLLLFGVLGTENGQTLDGTARATLSEETDHLEMRGMMQLHYGGNSPVGSPIDDHAPVFVLLLDTLVEMLPDQDHQHAGRYEQEQGHQDVQHQDQHDRLGNAAESQPDQEHQGSLQ